MSWPKGALVEDAAAYLWVSLAYGVEMFFMISGFVILGSLLRHSTLRGFLQDRFIRIYSAWVPALVAVATVCIVLKMKMFTGASALEDLGIFAGNLFLLPPLLPMPLVHQGSWSLSYEWIFYISAATGAWLLRARTPAILGGGRLGGHQRPVHLSVSALAVFLDRRDRVRPPSVVSPSGTLAQVPVAQLAGVSRCMASDRGRQGGTERDGVRLASEADDGSRRWLLSPLRCTCSPALR